MSISFEGIGELDVTFENKSSGGVETGQPFKLGTDGKLAACSGGDRFIGKALTVRGGAVLAQISGYTEMEYSGTAPTIGMVHLAAAGSGKVKTDSGTAYTVTDSNNSTGTVTVYSGAEYLVVKVDTANNIVGFFL